MVGWRNIGLKQIIWLWRKAPHRHWRIGIWARKVEIYPSHMVTTSPKEPITYVRSPKATKAMQYGRAKKRSKASPVSWVSWRMLMHFLIFVVNIIIFFPLKCSFCLVLACAVLKIPRGKLCSSLDLLEIRGTKELFWWTYSQWDFQVSLGNKKRLL